MFDIAFSELILIALVALVVIGPERLPRLARTAGHLLGRLQRYVGDVKADINREIQLEELKKMQQEVEASARSFESSVTQDLSSMESELNKALAEPEPAEASPEPTSSEAASDSEPEEARTPIPQMELGFDSEQSAEKKNA